MALLEKIRLQHRFVSRASAVGCPARHAYASLATLWLVFYVESVWQGRRSRSPVGLQPTAALITQLGSSHWMQNLSASTRPPIITVGVYTPCTHASVLNDTMLTLQSQTFREHEVIVINDGCHSLVDRGAIELAVANTLISRLRTRVHHSQKPIGVSAARHDIVMVTSQMQGIALVAYEAMACGKVFVGAAVGGQPELITKTCGCGVLVQHAPAAPQRELDAYAESLSRIVTDLKLRHRLGNAAKERIQSSFSLDNMYKCVLEAFKPTSSTAAPGLDVSLRDATMIIAHRLAALA